jgi:hypothetical protein
MPSKAIDAYGFSPDILEFIRLMKRHKVRYLLVGGEAVIYHGYPRVTGYVDFFYDLSAGNALRLFSCLLEFWNGNIPGIKTAKTLEKQGVIIQFGRPPHRIDLLSAIDGVSFSEAWKSRLRVELAGPRGKVASYYIGLRALIADKLASGRPRDLEDLSFLQRKLRKK